MRQSKAVLEALLGECSLRPNIQDRGSNDWLDQDRGEQFSASRLHGRHSRPHELVFPTGNPSRLLWGAGSWAWTLKPCASGDVSNGLAGALCAHTCARVVKSSVRRVFNLKLVCLALPSKADTSSVLYFSGSSIKAFQRRKRKKVEMK